MDARHKKVLILKDESAICHPAGYKFGHITDKPGEVLYNLGLFKAENVNQRRIYCAHSYDDFNNAVWAIQSGIDDLIQQIADEVFASFLFQCEQTGTYFNVERIEVNLVHECEFICYLHTANGSVIRTRHRFTQDSWANRTYDEFDMDVRAGVYQGLNYIRFIECALK